jgi:peptidoglycan/LPS O-acetylase OafA/YrhL
MIQLYINDLYGVEVLNPYFSNANMHIAKLAVAIFFMLSGAGLMLSTKENINYKQFYIKRFLRLMIPFYIVNILYFIYRAIQAGSISVLISGKAPWKIILGILGIDEWLTLYNFSGFSQGIGEWFLGCLIILYVLFPLFRKCLLKNNLLFLTIVIAFYIFVIYNYNSSVAMHQSIWIKGCEFIFGMYLGLFWEKIDKRWMVVTVPVVVFYFKSNTALTINTALSTTIFALAFFVSFSFLENVLQKSKYVYGIISFFSDCSYELFLIHHIVIYNLTPVAVPYIRTKMGVILLFIAELILMSVLTFVIKVISDWVIKFIRHRLLGKYEVCCEQNGKYS